MKKLIEAIAALVILAPAAAASTHSIKVSPNSVAAGQGVRVYGTVSSCPAGSRATISSWAFKGSARHRFGGVPAMWLKLNNQHKFSGRLTIKSTTQAANYRITGRCGGHIFGHTTLVVTPAFY